MERFAFACIGNESGAMDFVGRQATETFTAWPVRPAYGLLIWVMMSMGHWSGVHTRENDAGGGGDRMER